ncbi:hypothetical protein V6N13_072494 [Hibiscus sabdariffa]
MFESVKRYGRHREEQSQHGFRAFVWPFRLKMVSFLRSGTRVLLPPSGPNRFLITWKHDLRNFDAIKILVLRPTDIVSWRFITGFATLSLSQAIETISICLLY